MSTKTDQNRKTGITLAGLALAMVGLAYASVPLYQLFCQVTGYGGTPGRALERSELVSVTEGAASKITIRFNSDISSKLPWSFKPVQKSQQVSLGEDNLAFYVAQNQGDVPLYGTATFNVTPTKAAPYFIKTACFCFSEQLLEPGQSVDMPVSFYVDPALYADKDTRDVKTITLSYTFFPLPGKEARSGAKKEIGS